MDITAREPLLDGVVVKLGGVEFTVPALNFRALKTHAAALARFSSIAESTNAYEELSGTLPVITHAIQRNYPKITQDDMEELLDLSNYRAAFEAVMGVSGINKELAARHKEIAVGESRPTMVKSA